MDLKKENLPNNFLAEQGILNILLTNPSLIKNISNLIKPESFYYGEHEIIYSLMLELTDNEDNKSTNLTIIITELQNRGLLSKIGGIDTIIKILNQFENFSDLDYYTTLINEKYLRRLIIEFGKQIIILGYTTSTKVDIILEKIEQTIFSLNKQNIGEKIYSASEIIDEVFIDMKEKIKENKNSVL